MEACLHDNTNLMSLLIPSDINFLGSEQLQLQDGNKVSFNSQNWVGARELNENIRRLIHLAQEVCQKNMEMKKQMQKMENKQNELQHENGAFQERQSEQLVMISLLKSHFDEEKHHCNMPRKSEAVNDKIEELLEANEKQLEMNKKLLFEKQEIYGDLNMYREIVRKKDHMIITLQKSLNGLTKEKVIDMELRDKMQLETKLKTLEKELEERQAKEKTLQQAIQQILRDSKVSMKDLHLQIEQWRTKWEDMQKDHSEEVEDFQRQIQILCRQLERGDIEDIDIADVQREIIEVSSSFGANDQKTYGNLVYSLVKKVTDSKLSQIAREHKNHINIIEKVWERSIKSTILKIKKQVKDKLKIKYGSQVKDLKKSLAAKNEILKQFEYKISMLEKQLMDKKEVEMVQSQIIERLHDDLDSQLKREKVLDDKHKKEMSNLKTLFERRWFAEMKKIQLIQVEELKRMKDSKIKTVEALCCHFKAMYVEKLKGLQDKYARWVEDEKRKEVQRHNEEMINLQLVLEMRFEKEKERIVEMKDEELWRNIEALENRSDRRASVKIVNTDTSWFD